MANSKRFLLRLDPRLFEALRRWADDDLRSINAQIEYLLTDQARRAGRLPKRNARPHRADPEEPEADSRPPDRRESSVSGSAPRQEASRR
jgi:hypothetical protein